MVRSSEITHSYDTDTLPDTWTEGTLLNELRAYERFNRAVVYAGRFTDALVHVVGTAAMGMTLGFSANAALKSEGITPDFVPNFATTITDRRKANLIDCNAYPSDSTYIFMSPNHTLTETFGTVKEYVPSIDGLTTYTRLGDGIQLTTNGLDAEIMPLHGRSYSVRFAPGDKNDTITLDDGSVFSFGPTVDSERLDGGNRIMASIACQTA